MSRRPTLTLEEREERKRSRWRKQKARERKESVDSQWLRHTNFGYFEEVEVFHWHQLVEYLVASGFLAEIDADNKPRISAAADRLLEWYVGDEGCVVGIRPGPDFVGKSGAGIGTVQIKITMRLVEALGLTHECNNRCKIKQSAEELIFALYSNIGDIFRPWPTSGKQWMRPLYDPPRFIGRSICEARAWSARRLRNFGKICGTLALVKACHQAECSTPMD